MKFLCLREEFITLRLFEQASDKTFDVKKRELERQTETLFKLTSIRHGLSIYNAEKYVNLLTLCHLQYHNIVFVHRVDIPISRLIDCIASKRKLQEAADSIYTKDKC